MTYEEAIKILEQPSTLHGDAIRLAIEALEKQIPKRVEWCTDHTQGIEKEVPVCPTCDYYLTPIEFIDDIRTHKGDCEHLKVSYCEHCSQAIDWSEGGDEE